MLLCVYTQICTKTQAYCILCLYVYLEKKLWDRVNMGCKTKYLKVWKYYFHSCFENTFPFISKTNTVLRGDERSAGLQHSNLAITYIVFHSYFFFNKLWAQWENFRLERTVDLTQYSLSSCHVFVWQSVLRLPKLSTAT